MKKVGLLWILLHGPSLAYSICPTTDGGMCIFPFKSGLTTYSECADYQGRKWCATSLKEDGMYKGYGYCDVGKCRATAGENMPTPSNCPTEAGEKCIFPFKSGSTTHAECADYKGKKWCATSLQADGSYKGYGYCNVAKCGGGGADTTKGCVTDKGDSCVFPFKDGTTSHAKCANYRGTFWCATTLKANGAYDKWGKCKMDTCRPEASGNTCPTVDGARCIFPFKDGSTTHNQCADYKGRKWCATSLASDGTYAKYGYCDTVKCNGGTVTKPPASDCPTEKGKYCVFPFKSGSTTYDKCALYQGKHWCATSLNDDSTYKEYDYCDMAKCGGNVVTPKPPVVSTCPTEKGKYCVFPFKSGSTTHKKCTPYQGKHWCATSLKADGTYEEYDYCDMAKCGENVTPTPTKPPVVSNCPTDTGKSCVFPFKDGSTTHSECADYKGKKWCATSLKADGSYNGYGYCDMAKCGSDAPPTPTTSPAVSNCPTDAGKNCMFPFKSGSTTYEKCAPYGSRHWCATSLKEDGSYKDYGYCDMAKCAADGLGKCRFTKENQSVDRYDFSLPLPSKENGTRYKIQLEFDISTEVEFGDNIANCGGNYCLLDYSGSSSELVVTVYQASYSHLLDDQGLRVAPELQSVEIDFKFVCSLEESPVNVTVPQLAPVGQPEEQLPPGEFYPNFLPGGDSGSLQCGAAFSVANEYRQSRLDLSAIGPLVPAPNTAPVCPTTGGRNCVFPFLSGSVSHTSCAPYHTTPWCATSLTADGGFATWDYCDKEKCPHMGKQPPSCVTDKEEACVFPFKSGSKSYADCADYRGRKWCATSINLDGSYKTYGYCDTAKCSKTEVQTKASQVLSFERLDEESHGDVSSQVRFDHLVGLFSTNEAGAVVRLDIKHETPTSHDTKTSRMVVKAADGSSCSGPVTYREEYGLFSEDNAYILDLDASDARAPWDQANGNTRFHLNSLP